MVSKRRLNPIVLCYHGCVRQRADALTFRQHIDDFIGQIRALRAQGYGFVPPSEYRDWYAGAASPEEPFACIQIDDGLDSTAIMAEWLIAEGIPFGLAIIGRRLRKRLPEPGFLSWAQLASYVSSGYAELQDHTHNIHHLNLHPDGAGGVESAPVLEGPWWQDDGEALHVLTGDARPYFDYSHIDTATWGFPIFGADPFTDYQTPITSSFRFPARVSQSAAVLRLWMALGQPAGAGYACPVEVRINGTLVAGYTIQPTQYATRAQWVEREYLSIPFDTPYSITAGSLYTVEIRTLTPGPGTARVYAIPDTSGDPVAVTSTRSLFPGLEGPDYADYPAAANWPARIAAIIGSGTGTAVSEATYLDYIESDLQANEGAVQSWLNAAWTRQANAVVSPGYGVPLYGSYADGTPVDVVIRLDTGAGVVAQTLQWRNVQIFGSRYAAIVDVFVGASSIGPWTKVARFAGGWAEFKVEEIDIAQAAMGPGAAWVRFVTINPSPYGEGLIRVYLDSNIPPQPVRIDAQNYQWRGANVYLPAGDRQFPVQESTEGLVAAIPNRFDRADVMPRAVEFRWFQAGGPWFWVYDAQPICRGSVEMAVWSRTQQAAPSLGQIVYPFGSYYSEGIGSALIAKRVQSINPGLETLFGAEGRACGYTITPLRNSEASEFREPACRHTAYTLGRHLLYGDVPPGTSLNLIAAYAGYLLPDAIHGGVEWQVSVEPDPAGNATLGHAPWLDWVAFDAWFFDVDGVITPGALNDGGTYDGITYADDRAYVRSRGGRAMLIVSNYNVIEGDVSPTVASYVVNHPEEYVDQLVTIAADWDGITCNLEAIPAADRGAATAFYQALARALHAVGKLLHITAPGATGTAYDAVDYWTGWCDHGELVKVVDRMKVMTYTESGPFSAAAPHAPDWFFAAVYDHLDTVIPAEYRCKVLVGANLFGHRWRAGATGADYVDYHQAYAEAVGFGVNVQRAEGEIRVVTRESEIWCGSPDTVRRAVTMATDRGYAGVGLWKADDGDLFEFFPQQPSLGRFSMPSFIDVRFPDRIARGAAGGPNFKTQVIQSEGGREDRNASWLEPLSRYNVGLAVRSQQDLDDLIALFRVARGQHKSFRFRDWGDYRATFELLGVGDGVRTTWPLTRTYSYQGVTTTRRISKPTPGTVQVFLDGEAQSTGWTVDTDTGIVSFSAAPDSAVEVRATFEFDVEARFGSDAMVTSMQVITDAITFGRWEGIELVEVRP